MSSGGGRNAEESDQVCVRSGWVSLLLEFYTTAQKRAGAHARAQVQASAEVHFTKSSVTGDWSSGPQSHPVIGPQSESLVPPEAEEDVQYISGDDDDALQGVRPLGRIEVHLL